MQNDEKKAATEEGGSPFGYNKSLVSLGVVSGALLFLIVIMLYLHFDAKITQFFEDLGSNIGKIKKAIKAKIR